MPPICLRERQRFLSVEVLGCRWWRKRPRTAVSAASAPGDGFSWGGGRGRRERPPATTNSSTVDCAPAPSAPFEAAPCIERRDWAARETADRGDDPDRRFNRRRWRSDGRAGAARPDEHHAERAYPSLLPNDGGPGSRAFDRLSTACRRPRRRQARFLSAPRRGRTNSRRCTAS